MLNILTAVSSAITVLLYLVYLSVTIAQNNGLAAIMLPVLVIILALVPVIFRKRLPKWLRVLFCAGMCFYTVSFAVFCPVVLTAGSNYSREAFAGVEDGQLVIVYGCRTYGYRPSRALAARLDAAYGLLESHPEALCIVAGGVGTNETVSEAESMRAYLAGRGISEDRIFKEENSRSTEENIRFSLEIIEREGLEGYSTVSVSSEFHLLRIRLLADSLGLKTSGHPAESGNPVMLLSNLVREYMSYIKMVLTMV